MAYLDTTWLLDWQSKFSQNEKRPQEFGVVDAVKASGQFQDFIDPETISMMNTMSSARDAQIPVMKDQTVTVSTSPSFIIPANLEETDQYAFAAVNVVSGFRHYPATYGNNAIRSEWAAAEKTKNVLMAMAEAKETALLSVLDARRTQVLTGTAQISDAAGDYNFNTTTDLLEIKLAAQKETMFYKLEALMAANKLKGNGRVITNPAGLSIQKSEALKYGAANDKNINALGFLGLDRLHESFAIASSAKFDGYWLRDGAIGVVENFPYDFAAGTTLADKKWSISPMEMPFVNSRVNVYTNSAATDATSLVPSDSNAIMTTFEEILFWDRFYVVYRYNSNLGTRANDIVKLQGLTT